MPAKFGITELGTYSLIDSSQELARICRETIRDRSLVSFDIETTGTNPLMDSILMISFARCPSHAYVFIPGEINIAPFLDVLVTCDIMNHYIKFDYEFMKAKYGIDTNIYWDTQVTHSIAISGMGMDLGGNGLGNLIKRYFGITLNKALRKNFGHDGEFTDEDIRYSAMDSLAVQRLYPVTRKMLKDSECEPVWETIEKPLIKVISNMELDGINVDFDSILALRDKYQEKVNELEKEIADLTRHKTTVKSRCVCSSRPRGTVLCDVCSGKKKVICPVCNGKRKSSCENCGGTGRLICPKCNGVGRVTCEICKGEGYVENEVMVSVNPGSPAQVIEYLRNEGIKIPMKERKSGESSESVDEKNLEKIHHPLAKLLIEYRGYAKALSAYLIPWSTPCDVDPEGRYNMTTKCIHAEITQSDTSTGRTTMKQPNLQAVPRELEFRHLFKAPEGYKMITCDFSQIELRVIAEISGDQAMREIFVKRAKIYDELNAKLAEIGELYYTPEIGEMRPDIKELHTLMERDNDIHSQTAILIFKLDPAKIDWDSHEWKNKRASSKCVSFGIPYGSGARTVAMRSDGAMTEKEAEKTIENYFATFPKVKRYIEDSKRNYVRNTCDELAEDIGVEKGRVCWSASPGGRRRFYLLPPRTNTYEGEVESRKIHASIQRKAINQPIQGCSADITKLAMVTLANTFSEPRWENKVKLRLMVHDELVTSCPAEWAKEVAAIQMKVMTDTSARYLKSVPSEVSCVISDCWEK